MSYRLEVTDTRFWIDRKDLERYLEEDDCTLERFLDDECWEFELDEGGNVTDIAPRFEYQSGEVEDSLHFLAAVVRKGSFIEFEGEDGSTGRFDFDGKRRKVSGAIFASPDDEGDEDSDQD